MLYTVNIIQVENINVELKVCVGGGGTNIPFPIKRGGGTCTLAPPPPPRTPVHILYGENIWEAFQHAISMFSLGTALII